jgi:crotonobetainyl-CoA:carnitine CoA-transferase CaiB-like acyl-CoA transferase
VPLLHQLNGRIAQAVAALPRKEAVDRLTAAGAPVSPVLAQPELADDPQLRARGVVSRDGEGTMRMGHPVRYVERPAVAGGDVPPLRTGVDALPAWREGPG